VLEYSRAGKRTVLRDVPHQDDCATPFSCIPLEASGYFTHLTDAAGGARQAFGMQRLDRVDDADVGTLGFERREHCLQRGLAEHRHRQGLLAQTLGSEAYLRR